jgi:hypothetical protein
MKPQIRPLYAITLSVALCQASSATTLSGLVEATTSTTGSFIADQRWSTQGNGSIVDLFVIGSTNISAGAFVNGPSDSQAAISITLTPGTYKFSFLGGGGVDPNNTNSGLNIYFDGSTSTPGISVFGPVQSSATVPSFSPDGASATEGFNLATVPGANSIIYSDGANQVTLTSYSWALPSVNNVDRVSQPNVGFSSVGPDGSPDWVGQITLNVVAVPEPGTGGLLAAGSLALLGQLFRTRKLTRV